MSVKFKIDFTIDGETLFKLMSKMLPIENLHVEEVVEREPTHVLVKPKHEQVPRIRRKKGSGFVLNPHAGCNAIILKVLSDGLPHYTSNLFPAVMAGGYVTNGIQGRLKRLGRHGFLSQPARGRWQLTAYGLETVKKGEQSDVIKSNSTRERYKEPSENITTEV